MTSMTDFAWNLTKGAGLGFGTGAVQVLSGSWASLSGPHLSNNGVTDFMEAMVHATAIRALTAGIFYGVYQTGKTYWYNKTINAFSDTPSSPSYALKAFSYTVSVAAGSIMGGLSIPTVLIPRVQRGVRQWNPNRIVVPVLLAWDLCLDGTSAFFGMRFGDADESSNVKPSKSKLE